ncbi:hypothetical protein KIH74_25490 [Kineosporia sp. J2-2]|uniref:Uncharacterized protein n=1 Tax=Kineosporia corallincola TaxID=2835133 RepID=A0ABS5TMJ8_9ACTN|nr:hypothetical protein [Kineosporia corallincola]MBT0772324.1 hypothetical protein [Kineosporia corallincola]
MNVELDRIQNVNGAPAPSFIGQATAVEQSRAVAEVQAAVVVAQQRPRDIQAAIREMRDVCRMESLANRAFYSYKRGGQAVTGPSVHLARELARIWGNCQFGIKELRRDDIKGESEMQAVAWDLQTNARSETTFVVPHKRDTKTGVKQLTDMRDIYESNANNGARRARAMIFAILPSWFVDEAVDLCNKTLREGGGKPLPQRIAGAIDAFSKNFQVTEQQLADQRGRSSAQWDEHDVAQLTVLFKSLTNGELRKEDVFETDAGVKLTDLQGAVPEPRKPVPAPTAQDPNEYDPTMEPGWNGGDQ